MWALAGALLAAVTATGCEVPQSAQDDIACTIVCRCQTALPSQEDACITDCVGDIGPVSDDCAACINTYANACPTLFDECGSLCGAATQSLALDREEGEP